MLDKFSSFPCYYDYLCCNYISVYDVTFSASADIWLELESLKIRYHQISAPFRYDLVFAF